MHYRIYVIGKADSRADMMEKVHEGLAPHKEYYDEEADELKGFWDWYKIGGRWSGAISNLPDFVVELDKEFERETGGFVLFRDDPNVKKYGERWAAEITKRGTDVTDDCVPLPCFLRSQYGGYSDDIQPLNQWVFDRIADDGVIEQIIDEFRTPNVLFLNGETRLDSIPEGYWVAVVDCHS